MTIQPDTTANDPETTALAALESRASAISDPSAAVDTIVGALDYLHSTGSDPAALDDIHASASDLVESVQQLDGTLKDTVDLARILRQQREDFRTKLAGLKTAIVDADTSVPEIQDLYDILWTEVEECNLEWLMYSLFDEWEKIVDELINVTPLDEGEARNLVDILGSEELPMDHALWAELSEWIVRAKTAMDRDANS